MLMLDHMLTTVLTNCTESTLKPLNVALKKSICIITGVGRYNHTIPLYKAENILPLHENIEYNELVFMHSYKYSYCPNSFTETCRIQWQMALPQKCANVQNHAKLGLLIEKFLKD